MSITHKYTLLCDEFRQENNGKFFIIGLYTPDIAVRFDPQEARRWLAESSHRGPIVIVVVDPPPAHCVPLAAAWMDVLGRDVETVAKPIAEMRRFAQYAHVTLTHWLAHGPDPGYFLRGLLRTGSRSNNSAWSYAPFDALIDSALAEPSGPARLALFHEADRLAVQDQCAVIPLLYGRYAVAARGWVHGLWEWGAMGMPFDEVVVDERSPRHHGSADEAAGAAPSP